MPCQSGIREDEPQEWNISVHCRNDGTDVEYYSIKHAFIHTAAFRITKGINASIFNFFYQIIPSSKPFSPENVLISFRIRSKISIQYIWRNLWSWARELLLIIFVHIRYDQPVTFARQPRMSEFGIYILAKTFLGVRERKEQYRKEMIKSLAKKVDGIYLCTTMTRFKHLIFLRWFSYSVLL